jgi:NADH-quinone oxidoreductase subunit G
MLPIAPFTETSGTFVNTEGRAQSFNGTVKPRGDARPAWKVLRVLGNLLNLAGFDYESSESVRTEITGGAVDLSARCTAHALSSMSLVAARPPVEVVAIPGGLERIADVPIYSSDPLVRRAAPLQATRDAATPRARVNGRGMASLGLRSGDTVRVAMTGSDEACDLVCQLDERVADGCVAIAAAHPTTSCLPAPFGSVRLTRVADVTASPNDAVVA